MPFGPLLAALAEIRDPRRPQGQRYSLRHLLLFSVLAVLAGATSYQKIITFIAVQRDRLNAAFGACIRRAPAVNTLRNLFLALGRDDLEDAFRRHARELIESHEHSIYPCDANSPYYKIVEFDGIIICLGVTTRQLSFVHCVEDNLRHRFPLRTRTEEVYRATVRDRQGREVTIPTVAQTDVTLWLDIPRFMKRHVDPAVCRAVRLDGVDFFTARAKQLYVRMEELALKNVTCYTRGAYARHARARALP